MQIGVCTNVFQSGSSQGKNLASAFFNRGSVCAKNGNYDRAIQDLDQAIKLKPSYADAFNIRGIA